MKVNEKVTLFFQENQFFLSVHVRLLAESIDLLVERNGVTEFLVPDSSQTLSQARFFSRHEKSRL